MIKFRNKKFSIQEGHYTGPKTLDRLPGVLETVGKGAGIGAGIGAVTGGLMDDNTVLGGALTGAKWGTLGGIATKLLLNYFHKPMSSIKYQEVDRGIRRQFGVYQVAGIVVGENVDKRAKIEEKFSFNDRNVTAYKITFTIHDNQVIMYTFGLSKEDLDKVNKVLDSYCRKFFGMEYDAKVINLNANSYSVNIKFTNYMSVCDFIMELSNTLGTKINLLDNNAIVTGRITEACGDEEDRNFSESASISKYDAVKVIGGGLSKALTYIKSPLKSIPDVIMSGMDLAINGLGADTLGKLGITPTRGMLNNKFLLNVLKKNYYIEGHHFSEGDNKAPVQMSIASGIFMISAVHNSKEDKAIGGVYNHWKNVINKSKLNNVSLYTYAIRNENEFATILKKIMSLGLTPNVFNNKF